MDEVKSSAKKKPGAVKPAPAKKEDPCEKCKYKKGSQTCKTCIVFKGAK